MCLILVERPQLMTTDPPAWTHSFCKALCQSETPGGLARRLVSKSE
jgi:hypothetical protein